VKLGTGFNWRDLTSTVVNASDSQLFKEDPGHEVS
jgi:hypothetical protein